jgi:hypothetical protein
LRRDTGIVVAIYALLAVEWTVVRPRTAWLLALLLVHHAAVFAPNWIALHDRSQMSEVPFFAAAATPAAALDRWSQDVAQGTPLDCRQFADESQCRYEELYAAIAGSSEWNGLGPVTVRAFDLDEHRVVEVTRDSWPAGSPRH